MELENTITPSAESIKISIRLKELRSKNQLTFEQLKKILFEKYKIKISVDSLKNYEITQEHIRANSNLGMRIEYLNCLADYYGVTTDYLLGRTDDPSPHPSAVEELGLSPLIVDNLKSLNQKKPEPQITKEALELILSPNNINELVRDISQYLILVQSYCDIYEQNMHIAQQYTHDGFAHCELGHTPAIIAYLPPDMQTLYRQNLARLEHTEEDIEYRLFRFNGTTSRIMDSYFRTRKMELLKRQ